MPAPWSRSSGGHIAVDGTSLRIVGTVSQLANDGRYEGLGAERIAVWEAALVK